MSQPIANRSHIIWITVISLLICLTIVLLPTYITDIEWTQSISYAGSMASIIGIVTIIIQTYGVSRATDAINKAVEENNKTIKKLLTIDDISKHLQMLREIDAYVNQNRWDVAHLRLNEMHLILVDISSNINIYSIEKSDMDSCLSDIRDDLRNLNRAIHNNESIDGAIIANHIDAIGPILYKVRTYITALSNDFNKI